MNLHEKERKTVLVLKNVNKEFHDIKAVSDLNLHLKKVKSMDYSGQMEQVKPQHLE